MSTTTLEQPELGLKTDTPKTAPNVIITPKASEEVRRIMGDQGVNDKLYLRLRVVGGGCSGFQHKLVGNRSGVARQADTRTGIRIDRRVAEATGRARTGNR